MFKMLVIISPLILRTCSFSSSRVIGYMNQTKPKLLYRSKVKSYTMNQCHNSADTSPPGSPTSIKEVDYTQLKEYINNNEALIIDVRTKQELAETGVIPNSYNIPLDELSFAFRLPPEAFLEKYKVPKPDENKTIIFSCAKGIRSLIACNHLAHLGYKDLFNYTEGWCGWETHK